MAINTYVDLQSQVSSYLARSDLTSQIPTFIQLTEAKLQRKFVGVTSLSDSNLTNWMLVNNPDVYLYGALLEAQPYLMDDARIATWADIYTTVVAQVRYPSASANFTNYTGLQSAIEDWLDRSDLTDAIPNFIKLAESVLKRKFGDLTSLSVGSPTNWLLTSYPDIYLYASLLESAPYIKDDARVALWKSEYEIRISQVRKPNTTSTLASYSGFVSTIADYLGRQDLVAMIPTFVQLAETRLRRELRLRVMLKVSTTDTVANDSTVELPADFLEMRDLHFNTNPITVLKYNTPSIFYRNSFSTISGKPVQYTVLANEFQLAPIPDTIYELQMLYYAAPPYLMNDARLNTWATLYQRGLDALNISDNQGEYAGSPLTMTVALR